MSAPELLPCPFCGGEAEVKLGGPGCAWISCRACPAETDDGSIPRIIAAWNARAADVVTVLAVMLGRTAARIARGNGEAIDKLLTGAEQLAVEEAASFAGFFALADRIKSRNRP